jgi:hypothetical protein
MATNSDAFAVLCHDLRGLAHFCAPEACGGLIEVHAEWMGRTGSEAVL